MTDRLTDEQIAELERMESEATAAPWRPEREPPPVGNFWFDGLPPRSVPIESTGTAFALGVAVGASPHGSDAALIAAARNALPSLLPEVRALRAAARQVITDRAQDRIEDPIGASEREPYSRIHNAALDGLAVAVGMRDPPRKDALREAAQAVVDAYCYCRERNSMSGFWTHLDDLAAELDGRAEAARARGLGREER